MASLLLFLTLVFTPAAAAGEVLLTTDTSVAVSRDGVTIARATGPGQLSLGEFPPGSNTLQFHRAGLDTLEAAIDVPKTGALSVRLEGAMLHTDTGKQALALGPPPIVILKPYTDQQFSVIINDTERVAVSGERALDHLGIGSHSIEIRSPDNLTVWAKGYLTLQPGATIVLDLEAGRPVKAIGSEGAWNSGAQAQTTEQ